MMAFRESNHVVIVVMAVRESNHVVIVVMAVRELSHGRRSREHCDELRASFTSARNE